MSFFRKSPAKNPDMVSLVKTAAVSLEKKGLTGHRAAVYLVLDHSGSMARFYRDGSVQRLAEQALGLSANLDDDGEVPITFFSYDVDQRAAARLDNYGGLIDRTHKKSQWGSTNYAAAMRDVVAEYEDSGSRDPAFVIFQTDGAPDNPELAEQALRRFSDRPIFWAFVGFGESVKFLENLDTLTGRTVDNASFFHAENPHTVTDAELYDGLTHEYAGWLAAARAAGILS